MGPDRFDLCDREGSYEDREIPRGRWGGWGDGREERCLDGWREERGTGRVEFGG